MSGTAFGAGGTVGTSGALPRRSVSGNVPGSRSSSSDHGSSLARAASSMLSRAGSLAFASVGATFGAAARRASGGGNRASATGSADRSSLGSAADETAGLLPSMGGARGSGSGRKLSRQFMSAAARGEHRHGNGGDGVEGVRASLPPLSPPSTAQQPRPHQRMSDFGPPPTRPQVCPQVKAHPEFDTARCISSQA